MYMYWAIKLANYSDFERHHAWRKLQRTHRHQQNLFRSDGSTFIPRSSSNRRSWDKFRSKTSDGNKFYWCLWVCSLIWLHPHKAQQSTVRICTTASWSTGLINDILIRLYFIKDTNGWREQMTNRISPMFRRIHLLQRVKIVKESDLILSQF